jgi:hypothetical protein
MEGKKQLPKKKLWRTPDANMERGKRSYENMKSRIERKMPLNLNDQLNAIEKGLLPEPKNFPTPTAQDAKNNGGPSQYRRNSLPLNTVVKQKEVTGSLNPTWVEWLMGFPTGWTDLKDSETQ